MVYYSPQQKRSYYKKLSSKGIPMVKSGTLAKSQFTGKGDYKTSPKTWQYTGPASMLGAYAGGLVGGPVGAGLGYVAGNVLGNKFLGHGDYKTTAKYNVLSNTRQLPTFATSGFANAIKHREYVGEVISSATPNAFKIQSFDLSPTNTNLYPWLSSIAENYQQYKAHGIVFEFRSTSGDISTTTALGTVMMATTYNANAEAPTSKIEMMNQEFSNSCKPSQSTYHAIECAPFTQPLSELYTNNNAPVNGGTVSDKRLNSFGTFHIATSGFPGANTVAGELYVSFLFEFSAPSLPRHIGGNVENLFIRASNTAGTIGKLGPIILNTQDSGYNHTIDNANPASTSISFDTQPGNSYTATFNLAGMLALTSVPTISITSGATVVPVSNPILSSSFNIANPPTATASSSLTIRATGTRCTILIIGANGDPSNFTSTFILSEVDASITGY